MPQNRWNGDASHGRCTSQEFGSIHPRSTISASEELCRSAAKEQAWHWYKDIHDSG
uniref:Uncharacterized protein n=1 Tax=Arundo donax TaxID=35708 RepID=A0A0A9FE09_ARUDO